MTDTPMTPDRERMIRIWHEELHRMTDPTAVARREALGDLLAEVDRLRKALSDAADQVAELEDELGQASAENAALKQRLHEAAMARVWTNEDGKKFVFADDLKGPLLGKVAPVDEATEMAEGAAELEAMRREHPDPCRVPASPDCTCPLTPEQALRIERDRPESRTTHDCKIPLVRRFGCGHCPHEVCQDCDRCPHTCECTP